MMQRLPFSIGLYHDSASNDKKRMLNIDLEHPKVSNDESGERLFRDDGSTTDYLERASGLLETIHQSYVEDRAFAKKLAELDLLESVNMKIRLANASKGKMFEHY